MSNGSPARSKFPVMKNQPLGLCKATGCIFSFTQLKNRFLTFFSQQKSREAPLEGREFLFWFPLRVGAVSPRPPLRSAMAMELFLHCPSAPAGLLSALGQPPRAPRGVLPFTFRLSHSSSAIWGWCRAHLAARKELWAGKHSVWVKGLLQSILSALQT